MTLDVSSLLTAVSDEEPSGPDLEYDPEFSELEQAARGKPEQQYGETVIEAEDPDWKTVRRLGLNLLKRTKDFRIAIQVGNACLFLDNLDEFREVIELAAGYIRDFWPSVHPALDEDDDNDPTERINAIASIQDPEVTLNLLRNATLISLPGVGAVSYQAILIARGELSPEEGTEGMKEATVDGIFQDCSLDELRETKGSLSAICDGLEQIESCLTEQVGMSSALNLEPIRHLASAIDHAVDIYLERRDAGSDSESSQEEAGGDSDAGSSGESVAVATHHGEIRGREDVIRAIDRICEYYEKYEPSSPLPLLLNRAKRLATKSFMEIIRDLTPDALDQATSIGGVKSDSDSESETDDDEY
ncbi:MAG: type VI secretion system protein TssA [Planctomycetota bacterium]